ncbi:MAG: type II secretion system major pseudopilin GspG [Verrucomicrobiales bacterium]
MKVITSSSRRATAGFTLVEIVLVLAIIALLLGLAVSKIGGVMGEGKNVKARADIGTYTSMLTMYNSNAMRYPTTEQGLKALVDKPSTGPAPRVWRRLMDSIDPDPWGNEYRYQYPGKHNGVTKPDVWSSGPDMQDGNDDDIGNWQNN